MPRHIAFIMDGNGRWATEHSMQRADGYRYGLLALMRVLECLSKKGVEAVTVYAFSTENFQRPTDEINGIFDVVESFNLSYEGDMRITYMGDFDSLPDSLVSSIEEVETRTCQNGGITLNIALGYGARADVLRAAKLCYDHGEFTKEAFENNLSSSHLAPLDLIVRTGEQKRLSNFMLYESAYAELIFLDKLWPDVNSNDVDCILQEFEGRIRKFGK